MSNEATMADYERLRIRIGTVTRAEPNTTAREPAYRLWIDFGDLGVLQSSAKITDLYTIDDLVGRRVVAVTGFPPCGSEASNQRFSCWAEPPEGESCSLHRTTRSRRGPRSPDLNRLTSIA